MSSNIDITKMSKMINLRTLECNYCRLLFAENYNIR